MGASREIVVRAARRVALSTTGEVVGRAVNLVTPFALLAVHSAGALTDSFFLAVAIAFFAQGTLANVVANALVPRFIDPESEFSLHRYVGWAAIAALASGLVAFLFASGPLTTGSALIASLSVFVMAGAGLLASPAVAMLNVEHRYGVPGITWGFRLVPLLLYLSWRPETPTLYLLLAGIAVSDSVRSLLLLHLAKDRLSFNRGAPPVEFPTAALHLILASAIAGLNPLLARFIAGFGSDGDVSMFEAADRLFNAIVSLATIGVGNVILVYLARLAGSEDEPRGWRSIWRSALSWSVLWLVLSILIWRFLPIGSLLLSNQVEYTGEVVSQTFIALAIGIPGFIMTMICGRRLLTLNHTRSLVPMAAAGLICSTSAGVVLFKILGPAGIAVALSMGHYLVAFLMWRKLNALPTPAEGEAAGPKGSTQ